MQEHMRGSGRLMDAGACKHMRDTSSICWDWGLQSCDGLKGKGYIFSFMSPSGNQTLDLTTAE